MRAVIVDAFGPIENLSIREVSTPEPKADHVRIAVKAAGIGFVDALIAQGKYQVKPPLPFAPGGEYAGVVDSVGAEVTSLKPGDRVIAGGFSGAFAEYAIAPAVAALKIPDSMSFAQAAMFRTNYATALHALKDRAQLQPGETMLVLGAGGGTGVSAIQIGKIMGARIIAAAATPEKRAAAVAAGADETVDYTDPAWRDALKKLTADRGVDVVFDPVGGPVTETAFRSLAWKGRHLVIGFAAGQIPALPINLALLKGASLVGVDIARFSNLHEPALAQANIRQLLDWFTDGRLTLEPGRILPFESFRDGLLAVIDRKAIGKIVLQIAE
jgi:NADPH2:quinone reductase